MDQQQYQDQKQQQQQQQDVFDFEKKQRFTHDFEDQLKQMNIVHPRENQLCKLSHEDYVLLSMPARNYQQIKSKIHTLFKRKIEKIMPKLFKEKILIKRRVLNDYINIVNKRGEIIAKIGSDFKLMSEAKQSAIFYFHKYYNSQYIQNLVDVFELVNPKYKYGLNVFMKSAQIIRNQVKHAGEQIEQREKEKRELEKKLELEKRRLYQEKKKKNAFWFLEEQELKKNHKDQQTKLNQEKRIATTKGYLINSQNIEEGKKDINALLINQEIQKYGSDSIKQKMFVEDMKEMISKMEQEEKSDANEVNGQNVAEKQKKHHLKQANLKHNKKELKSQQQQIKNKEKQEKKEFKSIMKKNSNLEKLLAKEDVISEQDEEESYDSDSDSSSMESESSSSLNGQDSENSDEENQNRSILSGKNKAGQKDGVKKLEDSSESESEIYINQKNEIVLNDSRFNEMEAFEEEDDQQNQDSSKNTSTLQQTISTKESQSLVKQNKSTQNLIQQTKVNNQLVNNKLNSNEEKSNNSNILEIQQIQNHQISQEQISSVTVKAKSMIKQIFQNQSQDPKERNSIQQNNIFQSSQLPNIKSNLLQQQNYTNPNTKFSSMNVSPQQSFYEKQSTMPNSPQINQVRQKKIQFANTLGNEQNFNVQAKTTLNNSSQINGKIIKTSQSELNILTTKNQNQNEDKRKSIQTQFSIKKTFQNTNQNEKNKDPKLQKQNQKFQGSLTDLDQLENDGNQEKPIIPDVLKDRISSSVLAIKKSRTMLPLPSLASRSQLLPLPGFFQNIELDEIEDQEGKLREFTQMKLDRLQRRSNILGINPKLFEMQKQNLVNKIAKSQVQQLLESMQNEVKGVQENVGGDQFIQKGQDKFVDSSSEEEDSREIERNHQLMEYQRKNIQGVQQKAMNDMFIDKYYKGKLLGLQKDVIPQFSPEQLEELERLRKKKPTEWDKIKARINSNYQGQRMLIQQDQDEKEIIKKFGKGVLENYQTILTDCDQYQKMYKKGVKELKRKKKNSKKLYVTVNKQFKDKLQENKIKYWNMDVEKLLKDEKRFRFEKLRKIEQQNQALKEEKQEKTEEQKKEIAIKKQKDILDKANENLNQSQKNYLKYKNLFGSRDSSEEDENVLPPKNQETVTRISTLNELKENQNIFSTQQTTHEWYIPPNKAHQDQVIFKLKKIYPHQAFRRLSSIIQDEEKKTENQNKSFKKKIDNKQSQTVIDKKARKYKFQNAL